MIKKAVKRPDEVEYIEFKGRENFEEVCRFISMPGELVINIDGEEGLRLRNVGPDKASGTVELGKLFYRWTNHGNEENIYGKTSWSMMDKDEFFKRYKED